MVKASKSVFLKKKEYEVFCVVLLPFFFRFWLKQKKTKLLAVKIPIFGWISVCYNTFVIVVILYKQISNL